MAPTRLLPGNFARNVPNVLDFFFRAISPSDTLNTEHSRRDAAMISIPSTYTHIVDSPGIVVAIVFAVVCGFVLVIWVLALVFSRRGPFPSGDTGTVISSETSLSTYARNRYRRRRQREMSETHTSQSASRVSDGQAFAEVYDEEEYDSPPQSPRRAHRRGGGYRSVDPREYAGGGRSIRHVR